MSRNYVQGSLAQKIQYDVYEKNQVLKEKKTARKNKRSKLKTLAYVLTVFAIGLFVMYRYALIIKVNYDIDKMYSDLNQITNENQRLKIELEKKLDLNSIREFAEKNLGMQKPDRYQIIYLRVPKNDCTETKGSKESVALEEEKTGSLLDKMGKLAGILD